MKCSSEKERSRRRARTAPGTRCGAGRNSAIDQAVQRGRLARGERLQLALPGLRFGRRDCRGRGLVRLAAAHDEVHPRQRRDVRATGSPSMAITSASLPATRLPVTLSMRIHFAARPVAEAMASSIGTPALACSWIAVPEVVDRTRADRRRRAHEQHHPRAIQVADQLDPAEETVEAVAPDAQLDLGQLVEARERRHQNGQLVVARLPVVELVARRVLPCGPGWSPPIGRTPGPSDTSGTFWSTMRLATSASKYSRLSSRTNVACSSICTPASRQRTMPFGPVHVRGGVAIVLDGFFGRGLQLLDGERRPMPHRADGAAAGRRELDEGGAVLEAVAHFAAHLVRAVGIRRRRPSRARPWSTPPRRR